MIYFKSCSRRHINGGIKFTMSLKKTDTTFIVILLLSTICVLIFQKKLIIYFKLKNEKKKLC